MPLANLGLFTSFLLLGLLDLVINALFLDEKEAVWFLEGVGLSAMEATTADLLFSEAKRLRRCILKFSTVHNSGLHTD